MILKIDKMLLIQWFPTFLTSLCSRDLNPLPLWTPPLELSASVGRWATRDWSPTQLSQYTLDCWLSCVWGISVVLYSSLGPVAQLVEKSAWWWWNIGQWNWVTSGVHEELPGGTDGPVKEDKGCVLGDVRTEREECIALVFTCGEDREWKDEQKKNSAATLWVWKDMEDRVWGGRIKWGNIILEERRTGWKEWARMIEYWREWRSSCHG